jgi:hypothetical protein
MRSDIDIPSEIRVRLQSIVGQRCWHVVAGGSAGSTFALALGKRVPRSAPLKHARSEEFRNNDGEYNFLVWCSWRLDGELEALASSDQEPETIARALAILVDQTILSLTCSARAWDLCLEFSKGHKLIIFCDHLPEDASIEQNWELWCGGEALLVGPGYSWRVHKE